MGFLSKRQSVEADNAAQVETTTPNSNSAPALKPSKVPFLAIFLGLVASIGGFMFGYESGQISGRNCYGSMYSS